MFHLHNSQWRHDSTESGHLRFQARHGRWGGRGPWGSGGPLGGGWRLFEGGDIRLVLLALLAEKPGPGYELMTRLEERSRGAYQPSAGTIYPVLQQLEDEGLVTAATGGGRKVYSVTATGQAEAERTKEETAQVWRRVQERSDWGHLRPPDSYEVIGPALRLLKASGKAAAKAHGDVEAVAKIRTILDEARKAVEQVGK